MLRGRDVQRGLPWITTYRCPLCERPVPEPVDCPCGFRYHS